MKQCFYDSLSSPRLLWPCDNLNISEKSLWEDEKYCTSTAEGFNLMQNLTVTPIRLCCVTFLHNGLSNQASNTKRLSSCRCVHVWRWWQLLLELKSSVMFASVPALVSNSKVRSTHCVSHTATASHSFSLPLPLLAQSLNMHQEHLTVGSCCIISKR